MSENRGQELTPAAIERAISSYINIEKEKIDRDNRRTALQEKVLDFSSEQDRRQFDYATKVQDDDMELQRNWSNFSRHVVWTVVVFSIFLILGAFWFVLFGNEHQMQVMKTVISHGLAALGGYGILYTLSRTMRSIRRHGSD